MQLAQLNVGRLVAPIDAPVIRDFVDGLDPINALAEASPGFVWRLQTEDGDATAVRAYDDDLVIVNLTVWESVEALSDFVYRTAHIEYLRRRREWFEKPTEPSTACGGWRTAYGPRSPRLSSASTTCGRTDPPTTPSPSAQ